MADRVHAPMDAMQPTRGEAILDLVAREAERQQLPAGHDPMLSTGNPRQHSIGLPI